jgi:hypothetical protein
MDVIPRRAAFLIAEAREGRSPLELAKRMDAHGAEALS